MGTMETFNYVKWEQRLKKLMSDLPKEYAAFEIKRFSDEGPQFSGWLVRADLLSFGLRELKPEYKEQLAKRQEQALLQAKANRLKKLAKKPAKPTS